MGFIYKISNNMILKCYQTDRRGRKPWIICWIVSTLGQSTSMVLTVSDKEQDWHGGIDPRMWASANVKKERDQFCSWPQHHARTCFYCVEFYWRLGKYHEAHNCSKYPTVLSDRTVECDEQIRLLEFSFCSLAEWEQIWLQSALSLPGNPTHDDIVSVRWE